MIYGKKSFGSRSGILLPVTILVTVFSFSSVTAQDPTMDFIIAADSIYKAGGEEALTGYVESNVILVGAAVHQLIDIAIKVGDQGSAADEKENMEFAELVARIYRDGGGDPAPLELVTVYMGWTSDRRKARAQAKSFEEQATEARKAREFDKAAGLFARALKIYLQIGDSYSEAIVYGSYGVLYWYAGDFDSVLKYYRQALSARRSIDNAILEGRTLNGIGTANFVTSRYDSAEVYYHKAIELRRGTGDLGGLGTSLTYLGNTYSRIGRLSAARDSYEEAAVLVGSLGNETQQLDLLNSVANLYSDMGRLGRAKESYREALEIAVSTGNVRYEIAFRMNLAINAISERRYAEAMKELDTVSGLLESSPDPVYSVELLQNRGNVYLKTGEFDHARDDFLAFLASAKALEDPVLEMTAMLNIGYLYFELGAFDRGLAFADSALSKAGQLESSAVLNEAHSLAAQIEGARGNYPEALGHWKAALEINREAGAEQWMLHDEIGIATVTAQAGETEKARGLFIGLLPRIRETGLTRYESNMWMGIAHTFEGTDPDSAKYYYERALSLIEETGMETGSAELGAGLLSGSSRFYYEEVARYFAGMAAKTGDEKWSSEAFGTIERAKARGLLELLEGSLAGEHSAREDAVLDSIYGLDPAAADYAAALERLERDYRKIREERLAATTGSLSAAGDIIDLESASKMLPKNTVMFAYALGDSASQLWVIDRKGHDLYELPARSEFSRDTGMLAEALTRPGAGDARLKSQARKLYKTLIAPGGKRLEKAKYLVIVPDGCLFEIPFEVLLEEDIDEGADWSGMPFLARSRSILYAPSASVFAGLREKKRMKKYDIDIVAAGDPDYSYLGEGSERSLRPLPNTRAEVEGIGSLFKDDKRIILIGAEASEAAIKKNITDNPSRMIHIAAHGLVDPVTPAASSIALSASPGDGEDGFLHTLEILALPVESRLVVLSACETATGRVSRGEGVVGLSRAFLGAGASAVVSSLWAVPDESTAELMRSFYGYMAGKKKPAFEAINEARKTLLDSGEYSHPFHWASFIVIGSEKAPW
jgi:CHAT domain-containing protein/Tfp pilus assembly protein PilF